MVCYHLDIDHQQMETVWKLVKRIVVEQTKVLEDLHLDIIIVCTVYGVSKAFKTNAKRLKEVTEA